MSQQLTASFAPSTGDALGISGHGSHIAAGSAPPGSADPVGKEDMADTNSDGGASANPIGQTMTIVLADVLRIMICLRAISNGPVAADAILKCCTQVRPLHPQEAVGLDYGKLIDSAYTECRLQLK